jgi:hypothetical protein
MGVAMSFIWLRLTGRQPPLQRHLDEAGLGHVAEIADAGPPYTPRGCPFQAWSLGELEATSGPSGIARLDQSPMEFGSLRVFGW